MEQSQDNDLPTIKIIGLDRNQDGEVNVEFEVCDNFLDYAQFELGVEELSQEELGRYVKDMISKAVNEEDGYSVKQNFTENSKTNIDN